MKLKLLKKSATIELETKEEVEAFKKACEFYMTGVYQDAKPGVPESHYDCDDMIRELDKKFNKDKLK